MLQSDFKRIERLYNFVAVFITAVVCSQITSFFFIWRFYKLAPSDLEIYEGIWLRVAALLMTVFCYLAALKIFSNKKYSFLLVSFTGCCSSIFAVVSIEQFLTVYFKPLEYVNAFLLEFALSLFIGNIISLLTLSIFVLIKSFAGRLLDKRNILP